jgi:YfiH family protein
MLERRESADGVVYYVSPLIERAGAPHAFSTRIGGASPAPFDAMNLGNPNGCEIQDSYERIWENYRLLQRAIGCEDRLLTRLHQVHGKVVVKVDGAHPPRDNGAMGDALVTGEAGRMLSVRVADCVPILIAAADGRCVAAVHAGWRGIVANIIGETVRAMLSEGAAAGKMVAAVGPCIGEEAFEVGAEVLEAFAQVFGDAAPMRRTDGGKGHVDLRAAAKLQLVQAGVRPGDIDGTDRCTFRDRNEFFSHRRESGITGRMAAVIGVRVEL